MRKVCCVLAVLSLAVGTLSAQDKEQNSLFSIGFGGFLGGDFGGGVGSKITYQGETVKYTMPLNYFGGGAYVFLDATYVEATLGYFFGGGTWEAKMSGGGVSQTQEIGDFSTSSLNIGALFKYPVTVSPKLSIFPAVGMEYMVVLSAELDGEEADSPEDFSQFWFKFGGGFDYLISAKLYLRVEALYGFRLANTYEKDGVDALEAGLPALFYQMYGITPSVSAETLLGHGLTAKVAIGYRL